MKDLFKILTLCVILSFAVYALVGEPQWSYLAVKENFKGKDKFWHIFLADNEKKSVYSIRSKDPNIRIYTDGHHFHKKISLQEFGLQEVSEVAVAKPISGKGETIYLGDKLQKRIFYIILGKSHIREMPLHPGGVMSYNAFIASLHPVPQSIRHF